MTPNLTPPVRDLTSTCV